nr:MAG TPA: hypothetical protein [Caudoviricetes sp.]
MPIKFLSEGICRLNDRFLIQQSQNHQETLIKINMAKFLLQ